MSNITNSELGQRLWASANDMRVTMTADQYKNYLLGLVFYKTLSDHQLYEVYDLLENKTPESLEAAQEYYEAQQGTEDWNDLINELENKYEYAILPEQTYTYFMKLINNDVDGKPFVLSEMKQAFTDLEQCVSHLPEDYEKEVNYNRIVGAYKDLFKAFNIEDNALGLTPAKRNALISSVMKAINDIDFTEYGTDALGDAYEYLISQFASESGKKAGEFYTPQAVSEIIARIVTAGKEDQYGFQVYDPAMGSGSLMLRIRDFMNENVKGSVHYHGQEIKAETYNLSRMNMMLHQITSDRFRLSNGDTLSEDWPTDEPTNFDAVCMNPPYSQAWSAAAGFLQDSRFSPYGKLAPKSKADFAFLLHGFYHLKEDGTMGIVLPHGVLFRGAAEGTIRERLLEDGSIYAVIGLPAGIFFSTGIPTCIVVLKKNNTDRSVLFIDASKEFKKDKAQNSLLPEHIEKIVDAYKKRTDIEKYAHLATFEEIKENDFNLNIPRYVDTFEEEEPIDIPAVQARLKTHREEAAALDEELAGYFKELGL